MDTVKFSRSPGVSGFIAIGITTLELRENLSRWSTETNLYFPSLWTAETMFERRHMVDPNSFSSSVEIVPLQMRSNSNSRCVASRLVWHCHTHLPPTLSHPAICHSLDLSHSSPRRASATHFPNQFPISPRPEIPTNDVLTDCQTWDRLVHRFLCTVVVDPSEPGAALLPVVILHPFDFAL